MDPPTPAPNPLEPVPSDDTSYPSVTGSFWRHHLLLVSEYLTNAVEQVLQNHLGKAHGHLICANTHLMKYNTIQDFDVFTSYERDPLLEHLHELQKAIAALQKPSS